MSGRLRGWTTMLAAWRPDPYSLALLAIMVVAVGLRVYHLGNQSLWIDEMGEGTTARAPLDQILARVRYDHGAAPLDYLTLKMVLTLLGRDGTIATRSWAFLAGCLAVWLIQRLGRSVFNDRLTGLLAAFMLAFNAFHIYYAQEARFYAMTVVMGTIQLIAFLHALDSRSARAWVVAGAATGAALYTHYFLAVLLPIEAAYLLLAELWRARSGSVARREALRQVALGAASQVVAAAAFLPWLAYALPSQVAAGYPQLPPFTIGRYYATFHVLVELLPIHSFHDVATDGLTDLVLGLAVLGFVRALWSRNARVLLLGGLLVFAIPAAWTSDRIAMYFWSERQVIFLLVPLFLLAAAGARTLLEGAGRVVATFVREDRSGTASAGWRAASVSATAGLTLGLAALWSVAYWGPVHRVYANAWTSKEDWRDLAALARKGCSETHYWSFLDAHFSYGIGYYDQSLLARAHSVYHLADGTYVPSMAEAVAQQPIGPHDWIISMPSLTAGRTPLGTQDELLRAQGWRPIAYHGLTIYTRGDGCASVLMGSR